MHQSKKSHRAANAGSLFVLKVWEEHLAVGRVEWRGQILHVDSDTVRSFEDWPELVELIAQALHGVPIGAGRAAIRCIAAGKLISDLHKGKDQNDHRIS